MRPSARALLNGPLAAFLVALGVLLVLIAVAKTDALWMWLFIGSTALTLLAFWRFHEMRQERDAIGTASEERRRLRGKLSGALLAAHGLRDGLFAGRLKHDAPETIQALEGWANGVTRVLAQEGRKDLVPRFLDESNWNSRSYRGAPGGPSNEFDGLVNWLDKRVRQLSAVIDRLPEN